MARVEMQTATNRICHFNIPMITSVEVAVRLYNEKLALENKDIAELFGKHSSATVAKLKKLAKEKAEEMGRMEWSVHTVITECAYAAWGLNIAELEKRYAKIRKYRT